jgi:ubiquinol-cytochrome c reductase cytochrome b subunit
MPVNIISLYAGKVKTNNSTHNVSDFQFFKINPFIVKMNYSTQSAGNNFKESYVGSSETTREITSSSSLYENNVEQFSWYLSGLISGDGYLGIDQKKYPTMEITLQLKDLFTLHWLKSMLKFGQSPIKRQSTEACRFRVKNKNGMEKIFNLINGKIYLPSKVKQMEKLANNLQFKFLPCIGETINWKENAFLAGLFDAEGCWDIRKQNSYFYPRATVSQKEPEILYLLQKSFQIGTIYCNKQTGVYCWQIAAKNEIQQLLNYFSKFPLKTTKSIQIKRIDRLWLFLDRGYHKSLNEKHKTRFYTLVNTFSQFDEKGVKDIVQLLV